jgi:hypothetical protein
MNDSTRLVPAGLGNRRISNADLAGQGVQPQPRERHPPQRVRERWGEPNPVGPRQRTRRPQPPPGVWGAQPRRRAQARLPPADSRNARVPREAGQVRASSPEPKAKLTGARSEPGGAASAGGSRACAAPPKHAAGGRWRTPVREGVAGRADRASSPGSTREAPLGAWPAGPASCGARHVARRSDRRSNVRRSLRSWGCTAGTEPIQSEVRRAGG